MVVDKVVRNVRVEQSEQLAGASKWQCVHGNKCYPLKPVASGFSVQTQILFAIYSISITCKKTCNTLFNLVFHFPTKKICCAVMLRVLPGLKARARNIVGPLNGTGCWYNKSEVVGTVPSSV